jgi:hypothetical protein
MLCWDVQTILYSLKTTYPKKGVVSLTPRILSSYTYTTLKDKNDIKEREEGGFTSQEGSVGRNVGK